MASYLHSMVPAARLRNKQKCSSIDTEMILIWDCPGRSLLGLGRSGAVRSASGAVRDHPCWVRHGPGRSVVLPWWSWVIRVGSVFIRSAAVLSGDVWRCLPTVRHQSRDRRSIFTPVHPGSRYLLVRGYSGVIRDGPCWVRLWCDLGTI